MTRILIILFAGTLFITSCQSQSKKALDYSEAIVTRERSLETDIMQTENEAGRFINEGKYDSMAIVSKHMEELINEKLEEIKALEPPKAEKVDEFKSAAIEYFTYLRDFYSTYVAIANAPTEDQRTIEYTSMMNKMNEKEAVIKKIVDAQNEFAKANGFEIETTQGF